MKQLISVLLLLALAALSAACTGAAAPAPAAVEEVMAAPDSEQAAPMAAKAAAPGLPNTCAQAACPYGEACAAKDCASEDCPYAANCASGAACPAVSGGEARQAGAAMCPRMAAYLAATDTDAEDPYNACVDEPVCGVLEEAGGCLVTSDMLRAAAVGVYQKLTAAEAKARMESGEAVTVVDVRTQEEYDAGHIPGAILIPNETIGDSRPEALADTGAEILVYCRSGRRSREAVEKLAALGYTNVYDFGGIIDWPYETAAGEGSAA